jgi:phosphomevalonate kinase
MSEAFASAPGKLLLTGEYAVLEGAPALVAAVERRVRVCIRPCDDGQGRLTARPLGLVDAPTALVDRALVCPGRPDVELGVTGRFVPLALAALGRPATQADRLAIDIDSRALFDERDGRPVKLGLGSSAAVCAALAAALERLFPPEDAAGGGLGRWLSPYREALAGRASGADLAAALHGGLVVFAGEPATPSAASLTWPDGLHWQPIWTGRAASSTDRVARFRAWQQRDPDAAARLAELDALARRAVAAATRASGLIEAAGAYAEAIRALGAAMDVEIETGPHRRLSALARRLDIVYKTCGAGGGDFGAALDTDPERLAAFAAEAAAGGAVPVNLPIAVDGAGTAPPARTGTGD